MWKVQSAVPGEEAVGQRDFQHGASFKTKERGDGGREKKESESEAMDGTVLVLSLGTTLTITNVSIHDPLNALDRILQ